MTDNNPKTLKKNIESVNAPRQMNGSQEAPNTTNASIGPGGKTRPKTS